MNEEGAREEDKEGVGMVTDLGRSRHCDRSRKE